eukprot:CAMPEP_0177616308 /NCGR_PEP_ID=MMETSP0419_2-20121207/24056_1 /TAXON_ID=582737 /ORGANISM="Tetraselmis sp., Strain GSL018" /LENGTH=141 /DNA_ID=CAMNT_0019114297 /DNA_START=917 /DNA_END=1339 /DNA_ORIENTATION=-
MERRPWSPEGPKAPDRRAGSEAATPAAPEATDGRSADSKGTRRQEPGQATHPARDEGGSASGGKLSELCLEDKAKVSKVIQQVVALGGQVQRLEADLEAARKAAESAEQQRSAVSEESLRLRKKLAQALELLRAYQARVGS